MKQRNELIKQRQSKYRYFQVGSVKDAQLLSFEKPLQHQIAGELKLCYVSNSFTTLGLNLEELPQNTSISGRAGAGKTNIMRLMQLELSRLNIPFMAFDIAKYGTRYIKGYIPQLVILRANKEFAFNPLHNPPGTVLNQWKLIFCDVTCDVFGLFAASKSMLIESVSELYEQFQTAGSGIYPNILDLHDLLIQKRIKCRSRIDVDYVDRVKNKTTAITVGLSPSLNVQKGIPIDELLKYPCCIELLEVNSIEIQTWVISLIIAWIESYRTANFHFGKLRHVIFFDEASRLFMKSYEEK